MSKHNLTINQKTNLFWYFIVPTLIGITLIISLSPWFFELLATPKDRVFSGINRWSTDYYIYLSYVELGRRGQLGAKLLLTTTPQPPVFAHLSYTLPGFVLGKILGFGSIFIYHFSRSLYGLAFLIASIIFFYRLSKSRLITLMAFLLTFYVSGFAKIDSLSPFKFSRYLPWLQEQNIIGRATGPLHYNLGFVFFILSFLYFFKSQASGLKKILIFGLLLNLTLLANPFAFLILAISFFVYSFLIIIMIFIKIIKIKLFIKDFSILFFGFILSLPLLFYYQSILSDKIWGLIGMGPKYYVVTHPPINFWETALSIGPIFFLGVAGIAACLIGKIKNKNLSKNEVAFLVIWLTVQFFLFFFGDWVKIHPLRAFSGLYYLPLSLFSAYILVFIARFISKKLSLLYFPISNFHYQFPIPNNQFLIFMLLILFFLTLPNYYLSYKEQLFAFTDFKSFQLFSFPTIKQVEAFRFLEKNTPAGSGVLAMFEVSSQVMGFSGNSSALGMDHATKVRFYQNGMSSNEASRFLKNNHFDYVYFGYQEQSVGGNMDKLPYLKKIFENEEVKIFKVI